MMSNTIGGLSRKRLFCFLLVLASSAMCYVIVTSPIPLMRSPTYLRHAHDTHANSLAGAEGHHNLSTTEGRAEHTNCSCSNDSVLYDVDYGGGRTSAQNVISKNHTTSKNLPVSHRLIPKKGKTIMNNSLTGHLWNFQEMGDQQLYLFENLLRQKWSANLTMIATLRQELAKYRSELDDNSKIILHQKNIRVGEAVKFVHSKGGKVMTRDVYKHLPKSSPVPQGTRYRSCAVVGNSGIMLNSSCGKDIDKHDYVFRCNLAPLSPFRKDAGLKSNLTTMNPSMIYRNFQSLKNAASLRKFSDEISQYDGFIWIPCYSFSPHFPIAMKAISKYNRQNPRMVCGNPMHHKSVIDFWGERKLNHRLSTGFYLAMTALQLCDEVQLYGFWPFSARYGDEKSEVPYHYFDNLSADAAIKVHSMDKEFSLLVQLHTLGILRLNVGSCS